EWLIENKLIFTQAIGDITESDIDLFIAQLNQLVAAAGDNLHIHIYQDSRFIGKPYTKLQGISETLSALRHLTGWYVVLNKPGNRLFGYISAVAGQMVGIRMRPPFEDYQALKAFLQEQDE